MVCDGFRDDGALCEGFERFLSVAVARVEERFGRLSESSYAAVVASVARTLEGDGRLQCGVGDSAGRVCCGGCHGESSVDAGFLRRSGEVVESVVVGCHAETGSVKVCRGEGDMREVGSRTEECGGVGTSGVIGLGPNTLRNRAARKKRQQRRQRKQRRVDDGVDLPGESVAEAMEHYADVHGVSVAELEADDFEKGLPIGVADVSTKAEMKRLARQRAELYFLRNEREKLRLQREIEMEKATLEAGANVARVNNWISEVKSGNSKSDGMSKGSSSSGRVTKRSAWSGGSWRSRPKSDETKGSSFVPEEVYNAVVARVAELEEKEKELTVKYERAKDARYEALNHTFRVLDQRADVGMLTVADKAKYGKN